MELQTTNRKLDCVFERYEMAKIKDKVPSLSQAKDKDTKDKDAKETKDAKDKDAKGKSKLVGQVKKVIKKSRRKLGEEKFEKELLRTIEFLAQLQTKIGDLHNARESGKARAKVEKKAALKAGTGVEKKSARNSSKKEQPNKKSVKKPDGNGVGKKRKGLPGGDAALTAKPVAALQAEALSKGR
jgi:hypothetical protein